MLINTDYGKYLDIPKQYNHYSREEYHSPLVCGTEQAMLVEV